MGFNRFIFLTYRFRHTSCLYYRILFLQFSRWNENARFFSPCFKKWWVFDYKYLIMALQYFFVTVEILKFKCFSKIKRIKILCLNTNNYCWGSINVIFGFKISRNILIPYRWTCIFSFRPKVYSHFGLIHEYLSISIHYNKFISKHFGNKLSFF